ncbi:hypothetical protein F383_23658 [Gossypium arboreum]|uniref:Uncharacterized protein n=1 Tax=Gossypium arboreum TaxID=29729 RepID=A0A0B0NXV6_GOSAR|nr:hypothetical protein F383_23658 [Gossypium arboreum]
MYVIGQFSQMDGNITLYT